MENLTDDTFDQFRYCSWPRWLRAKNIPTAAVYGTGGMSLSHTHAHKLARRPTSHMQKVTCSLFTASSMWRAINFSGGFCCTVSQNMLYRMDGRLYFLLPFLVRLAQTCSGASTACYPAGTQCVCTGVKGARP